MLSTDRKPEPLPPPKFLLLDAPLYLPYSLTEVGDEVREEERAAEEAAAALGSKAPPPIRPVGSPPPSAWRSAPKPAHWRERERAHRFLNFGGSLDAYCIECHRTSVFQPVEVPSPERPIHYVADQVEWAHHYKYFHCSRSPGLHRLYFAVRVDYGALTITKVGQFPSLADLAHGGLKEYRRVLPTEAKHDLSSALGLFAHGVGVGSFVYLRRIFERLLEEAHSAAQQEWGDAENNAYKEADVQGKIGLLSSHLPETLVENRDLYGILSKGLHELSEDECNAHFPVVRNGIETILEERIAERRREARRVGAKRAVDRARHKLRR